ncbi:MAG: hypothetical protein M3387_00800 [Actinomycetota bacterium]|nr:hypothetical protein [Actinomycetota bacterium]
MSRNHLGKVQVHAVVRHDRFHGQDVDIATSITVVEVLPTKDQALAEVQRLNALNADKGCEYFWTPTRYWPEGRSTEPDPARDE